MTPIYDFVYEYDQLGNRLTKADNLNYRVTAYDYDVQHEIDEEGWEFPTHHNRLLSYQVWQYDSGWEDPQLLRTVKYTYWSTGTCSNILLKDEYIEGVTPGTESDYDWYHDIAMYYTTNDWLWRVVYDKWKITDDEPSDYTWQAAREFFYDSGRERYMSRALNDGFEPLEPFEFTDYRGAQPYGDCEVTFDGYTPVVSEQMQYLSGGGVHAQSQPSSAPAAKYYHGDLVRSTMLLTDAGGIPATQPAPAGQPFGGSDVWKFAYTAFGEVVGDSGVAAAASNEPTRYGYAGGWGYEGHHITLAGVNTDLAPVTLLHVGARWYQPDVGRFVQRDPFGIVQGCNVYEYCFGNPTIGFDPSGLGFWGAVGAGAAGALGGGLIGLKVGTIFGAPGWLIGGAVGAIAGAILGATGVLKGGYAGVDVLNGWGGGGCGSRDDIGLFCYGYFGPALFAKDNGGGGGGIVVVDSTGKHWGGIGHVMVTPVPNGPSITVIGGATDDGAFGGLGGHVDVLRKLIGIEGGVYAR